MRTENSAVQPLNYNGAVSIWDLHESFEHRMGVEIAMGEGRTSLSPPPYLTFFCSSPA